MSSFPNGSAGNLVQVACQDSRQSHSEMTTFVRDEAIMRKLLPPLLPLLRLFPLLTSLLPPLRSAPKSHDRSLFWNFRVRCSLSRGAGRFWEASATCRDYPAGSAAGAGAAVGGL